MTKQYIDQFIWGYQETFQIGLNALAERVLKVLGVEVKLKTFLVGVLASEAQSSYPVCVQPEEDLRLVALFADLRDRVATAHPEHELHMMFYSDEATTRDQPERIWRVVILEQIRAILALQDETRGEHSFVGYPVRIGDYRVAPVIQVPESVFVEHRPLRRQGPERMPIRQSLIEAAIRQVLEEGTRQLETPTPGRFFDDGTRGAEEVVTLAAASFLRAPGILIGQGMPDFDLLRVLNSISLMRYERDEGIGRLLLIDPAHLKLHYLFRLETPVPLRDTRWARKILELAKGDVAVVADTKRIFGIGTLDPSHDSEDEDAFWIDFIGHHQWDFRKGEQILMRTRYGVPLLPQEAITKGRFTDNVRRQFKICDPEALWLLFNMLLDQECGAMLMIAEDAAVEAERLAGQGTTIKATSADADLIACAVRIDGSILVDPTGQCHAIGVILDGPANQNCSGARGSRFNSAIRYVDAIDSARVAIVISDDRTIDIYPLLRKQIDRDIVERQLVALETATIDNFYEPRRFVDENRFYLTQTQCNRANAALKRINELPAPVGRILWITSPLEPDPAMNDGYYL
jgi:DisA bacterial checkpoint controller nucleotide-binding